VQNAVRWTGRAGKNGAAVSSWIPEGGWIAITLVVAGGAALVGALCVVLDGRRGAGAARWLAMLYVGAASASAAARIWLAVSRGRENLEVVPIVIGFGLAALAVLAIGWRKRSGAGAALMVAAACLLAAAVVANLEPSG